MAVDVFEAGSSLAGARRRLSSEFWRRPWLKGALLLTPPLAAFVFVYLAALVSLFVSSFWGVDAFTGKLIHHWTLQNFHDLLHSNGTYLRIAGRTIERQFTKF